MPCEVHTAIFHPLEMVNLHVCGAIRNSDWFEVLWPMDHFSFGLPGGLPIEDGMAILPQTPGLGAPLDRDAIENATLEMF
jgi:L-alanine-DL-glutamate epimerase-like enolase superfamily enzyme